MDVLLRLFELIGVELFDGSNVLQLLAFWGGDDQLLCLTIHLLRRDCSLQVMLLQVNQTPASECLFIPRGEGYSHILAIWVCATGKGMVFKPFTLG